MLEILKTPYDSRNSIRVHVSNNHANSWVINGLLILIPRLCLEFLTSVHLFFFWQCFGSKGIDWEPKSDKVVIVVQGIFWSSCSYMWKWLYSGHQSDLWYQYWQVCNTYVYRDQFNKLLYAGVSCMKAYAPEHGLSGSI